MWFTMQNKSYMAIITLYLQLTHLLIWQLSEYKKKIWLLNMTLLIHFALEQ